MSGRRMRMFRRAVKKELKETDLALRKPIRPKPRGIPQWFWNWMAKIIIKDLNI